MINLTWKLSIPDDKMPHSFPYKRLDNIMVPRFYTEESLDRIKRLKTRTDDIFISSYCRAGTHWLAYIVALIVNNGILPKEQSLHDVACFIGQSLNPITEEMMEKMDSPRIFFEHLPYKYITFLNGKDVKPRYIYIARNPKEVAVSFYNLLKTLNDSKHFMGSFMSFSGTWNEFFQAFIKGYKLSEEIIEILFQKTSFDEMKKDENAKIAQRLRLPTSSFFRAGTNNSWKALFTEEQVKQMDELLLSYTCNFNMDFN
uniref:Sulfotransferase domain-containing protein n=1 Tax=Acrobeloides nanus TaxID=290746 RepID=A0A914C998_9BILA